MSEAQQANFNALLPRGYTGHQQADEVGVIHMNGRIYDPRLGRFLQADSLIEDLFDPQAINSYSYVRNNPMNATDPTGHWRAKEQGILRQVAVIAITVATGVHIGGILGVSCPGPALAAALATEAALAGAVSGALTTGTLKGTLLGALSAFTFHQIGIATLSQGERIFAHGLAGGTLEALGGGKFGHGFVSAGLSKALSPLADTGNVAANGAINAAIGGTVSEITGGDFANGAVMAAAQYAFNQLARGGTGCAADPDCSAMMEEIDHEGIGRQNHAAQFVRDVAANTVEASNQVTTTVKENAPAIAITLFAPGMRLAGGVFRWGLSMGQTKYMLRTAEAAYKGSTVVGHALAKHAQRNPQIWGKLSGGPTKLAGAGMQHLREILMGKGQFQTITDPKTGVNWLEKRLPDGRGVRLQMDYMFKGFID